MQILSSESVFPGHPDKMADQISDAILDDVLREDPEARVAVETLVTTGLVVLSGEVTAHNDAAKLAVADAEGAARRVIRDIGYDDPQLGFDWRSCAVLRTIHAQSPDISRGVTEAEGREQGAGDQGMMFGYATDETPSMMPLPIRLAHRLSREMWLLRRGGSLPWLRPDGKCQVSVRYGRRGGRPSGRLVPLGVAAVVLSAQHTEGAADPASGDLSGKARDSLVAVVRRVLTDEGWWDDALLDSMHINPTGRFVVGGPHGDTGLTGRKIIVDTYGGFGRHGGGAFSGKDPSKVDRSAAYMARHIAKNVVASGLASECEVQLSYAIGVAEPVGLAVDTRGTGTATDDDIAGAVRRAFPLTPKGIIAHLGLKGFSPYRETAMFGHFGDQRFPWERVVPGLLP
jgi:S-adenosylmethionine synthetase